MKLYNSGPEAYEKPELFLPTKIKYQDPCEGKFVLPVCIEAINGCDSPINFFVKQIGGRITFAPRSKDVLSFSTVELAEEYINETLKPLWGEKWTFLIWSLSVVPK